MTWFRFNPEIKIGDLLTVISVFVAVATLLATWIKDRRLRKKEYADRIRQAAAQTLVALERWKDLALRLYSDIQPLITDADVMLVEEGNVIATRDFLWRGFVAAHAEASRRILEEQLEGAYAGLYGYDPKIHEDYAGAIRTLKNAVDQAYSKLLENTQMDVMAMENASKPFESALLGNRLRSTVCQVASQFDIQAEQAIIPIRNQMLALVSATDADIMQKRVAVTQ